MATVVDTPIPYGDSATTQRISEIHINLEENFIVINIMDTASDGTHLMNTHKRFDIWDEDGNIAIPTNIAQECKDLHVAVTASAKAQGWIGAGTTTDDLVDIV